MVTPTTPILWTLQTSSVSFDSQLERPPQHRRVCSLFHIIEADFYLIEYWGSDILEKYLNSLVLLNSAVTKLSTRPEQISCIDASRLSNDSKILTNVAFWGVSQSNISTFSLAFGPLVQRRK